MPSVVQYGETMLMFAIKHSYDDNESMETIEGLLDGGAGTTINFQDEVNHVHFHLKLWM
jgi:hypothetical protein